jgi:hypothetical protein
VPVALFATIATIASLTGGTMAEQQSASTPSRWSGLAATVRNLFWVVVAGVVILFAFFAALGALNPRESSTAWIAAGVLAVLWAVHGWSEHHRTQQLRAAHQAQLDRGLVRARERRGF